MFLVHPGFGFYPNGISAISPGSRLPRTQGTRDILPDPEGNAVNDFLIGVFSYFRSGSRETSDCSPLAPREDSDVGRITPHRTVPDCCYPLAEREG